MVQQLFQAADYSQHSSDCYHVITLNVRHHRFINPSNCACVIYPTVNDAVKVRMEGGVMDECEASKDVLLSDTMDQYRTFQMCERLLHSPAKLANQLLFQIPPHRQIMLIERCSHDALI